jgi:hypothetical protein
MIQVIMRTKAGFLRWGWAPLASAHWQNVRPVLQRNHPSQAGLSTGTLAPGPRSHPARVPSSLISDTAARPARAKGPCRLGGGRVMVPAAGAGDIRPAALRPPACTARGPATRPRCSAPGQRGGRGRRGTAARPEQSRPHAPRTIRAPLSLALISGSLQRCTRPRKKKPRWMTGYHICISVLK